VQGAENQRSNRVQTLLLLLSSLALTPQAASVPGIAPASESITVHDGMAVISSDGVTVAKTAYIPKPSQTYVAERSFFTLEERIYFLRRIYPREAWVDGNVVRLRMTAKQFRARSQNPPAY
jgi:hypothetical protein